MNKSVKQSLTMGLLCLPFGVVGGLLFGLRPGRDIDPSGVAFAAAAPVASLVSGTLIWLLMVIRRRRVKVWRGVLAGAVAVIFAHWLTLEMTFLACNAWIVVGDGDPRRMMGVGELTIGMIGSAVLTLFVVGWITIPIGCTLGGVLIVLQRRELPSVPDAAG
jgi:hypothetical protein